MIIEIQQINRKDDSYKCYLNNESYCDVSSMRQLGKNEYFFQFFHSGKQVKLYFNPKDTSLGNSMKDRFTTWILQDNNCIGKIVGSDKMGEYGVYHVEYGGKKYTSYVADVTQDDDYLCIYTEEQTLIAEIRRTKYPYRDYDYYVAFIDSDEVEELVCLLAVHIDFFVFNNTGSMDEGTYGSYAYIKGEDYHSAEFVKRIAAQDNFDLSKKVKKEILTEDTEVTVDEEVAKKKKRNKTYNWIIYIAFIGIFVYSILRWLMIFLQQ